MKNIFLIASLMLTGSTLSSCNTSKNESSDSKIEADHQILEQEVREDGLKTAYFASGCFWCVEAVFQSVDGVTDAISGYSGGTEENPTYQRVSSGTSSHAEAVKVIYDPQKIDFETLVKVFFGSHDPTTLNRQGPDRGPQYRSIAFYENQDEKEIIESYIKQLTADKTYTAPIVTEVKQFTKFWDAEDYHQEYERNHPDNPYVQNVSIPRLKKFQAKYPELLKDNH